jgi:hypothetical protein
MELLVLWQRTTPGRSFFLADRSRGGSGQSVASVGELIEPRE